MAFTKSKSAPERVRRWSRYKFVQLLRAPGGPSKVALGFAIGICVEMFTLPTYGLAFFLIFPLVYLTRASLAGALVGFVLGKIIYLPMAVLNQKMGGYILPSHIRFEIPFISNWLNELLLVNLKLIVGGVINGIILGTLFYFPVRMMIAFFANKRKEKRKKNRSAVKVKPLTERP
ncbi:DUF2062 domain-containing protein [Paenibacillus beijingensis]|uniref:DUF2062 domain-containing protein n=1 Tax=Paenibacillus beijingensis TaxID=1126833 RepID=A0A0D5NKQ6_9BACL|nr:DUF2062 domain-containing protein [Paenibacillus beijingensis]AJY75836.1 hypothetical protein VN24_16335 [Paenibacillus beijingensis]